ncbi:hypothetical protein JKG68_30490 [Microvirga aerilata]|uniref:Uncharacterized protein n=1 Tax=Microvirga aerilata TaxID=670292 RepID=A0A936ZJE4_9HYPH|nr:hypothetical protein [Microvirga aerilata]MBL0408214.1 hypothetical protein [Microvirga aerilata]
MSYHRHVNWSAAMRDLRRERAPRPAVNALTAQSIAFARACDVLRDAQARPLSRDGVYDRSAIMALAVALARKERAKRPRAGWRTLMSTALTFAWAQAKVRRGIGAH